MDGRFFYDQSKPITRQRGETYIIANFQERIQADLRKLGSSIAQPVLLKAEEISKPVMLKAEEISKPVLLKADEISKVSPVLIREIGTK